MKDAAKYALAAVVGAIVATAINLCTPLVTRSEHDASQAKLFEEINELRGQIAVLQIRQAERDDGSGPPHE